MTVRDNIDKYIAFFRDKTTEIGRLEVLPIYRKILYFVEIDTLSLAAFPSEKKDHKTRVMKFLDKCSNWSERNRVSAIQLKYSLKAKGKNSGPLFKISNDRINECGTRIDASEDLTFEEVQSRASSDDLKIVDQVRYDKLFYKYRNILIHEFREPGKYAIPSVDDLSPFSKEVEDASTGEKTWELVFPVKFLKRLCERSIDGLEKYLIENNQDPYESYERGPLWLRS
ncbi:MAG: hypothetical protein OXB94_00545 [Nitrospira sp.]|nr:hypothetical protein [Nitrospira sp.]